MRTSNVNRTAFPSVAPIIFYPGRGLFCGSLLTSIERNATPTTEAIPEYCQTQSHQPELALNSVRLRDENKLLERC